jgi:hypothetical protein
LGGAVKPARRRRRRRGEKMSTRNIDAQAARAAAETIVPVKFVVTEEHLTIVEKALEAAKVTADATSRAMPGFCNDALQDATPASADDQVMFLATDERGRPIKLLGNIVHSRVAFDTIRGMYETTGEPRAQKRSRPNPPLPAPGARAVRGRKTKDQDNDDSNGIRLVPFAIDASCARLLVDFSQIVFAHVAVELANRYSKRSASLAEPSRAAFVAAQQRQRQAMPPIEQRVSELVVEATDGCGERLAQLVMAADYLGSEFLTSVLARQWCALALCEHTAPCASHYFGTPMPSPAEIKSAVATAMPPST